MNYQYSKYCNINQEGKGMFYKNNETCEGITSIQRNRLLLAAERLAFLASLLEEQNTVDCNLRNNSINIIRKLASIVEDVAVNRSEQSILTRNKLKEMILENRADK